MMIRSLSILLLVVALAFPAAAEDAAPGMSQDTFQQMDAMLGNALNAYNAGNWKAFYKDWAQLMSGIATEQSFNSLYVNMYKKNFGDYKSRTFVRERSSVAGDHAVVVYKAKFSKKDGDIGVNYFRENGKWKLQQIQFN
ncbi:MAG: hypothetical protein HY319_06215 [Armatimonadetes bacterium]|nr:hypothetical protein [Armatimonadota bacterium]